MSDPWPETVADLLRDRADAREARDWSRADALRDRMRELGWEPIDSPAGSTARPVPQRTQERASVLDQPASVPASIVVIVDDHPEDLTRLLAGLHAHPSAIDHELVLVANAPVGGADGLPHTASGLQLVESELRLGWADAVNLGLHQARGEIVVLLDSSLEPTGDFLAPLLSAFEDPAVGLGGPWGVTSHDGRQFDEAPPGEVDAIEGYCLAIRREALRQIGGFDHRFRFYRNADLDLSFAVRDNGWKAVRTEPVPLERHDHRGWSAYPEAERDRLSKRNFYRFLKHWGDRRDLLLQPASRNERGVPR
ncbi:MAG TPA: glycosyltransferase [Candidatus Limnocylindria bacterium]